ncbi:hypothetical protein JEZ13_04225 [bacterium]|nr:hypothetical protein [bacterium]MBI9072934.1 hypothetical protein [Melioribacteraceae bacterium]
MSILKKIAEKALTLEAKREIKKQKPVGKFRQGLSLIGESVGDNLYSAKNTIVSKATTFGETSPNDIGRAVKSKASNLRLIVFKKNEEKTETPTVEVQDLEITEDQYKVLQSRLNELEAENTDLKTPFYKKIFSTKEKTELATT